MSIADLIAEARLNAPHSEDESLIMRLATALEVTNSHLTQLLNVIQVGPYA